jgi:hypothetical protein
MMSQRIFEASPSPNATLEQKESMTAAAPASVVRPRTVIILVLILRILSGSASDPHSASDEARILMCSTRAL